MKFIPYNPEQAYLLPPRVADVLGKEHLCFFLRRGGGSIGFELLRGGPTRTRGVRRTRRSCWWRCGCTLMRWGWTSSRRLEQRVREDLAFRYLAAGATPDFWTLNQFRRQHGRALNDLFTQVVELARAAGVGTPGACSDRFDPRGGERLAEPGGDEGASARRAGANPSPDSALAASLQCRRSQRSVRIGAEEGGDDTPPGAAGRDSSRLEQLKRARQRHISRTDPDSRFLRDRRGFTLGYTVDVAVSEDHLIVEQRVTQAATDNASLLPVVEAVERRCGEMPQKVSADSGFF